MPVERSSLGFGTATVMRLPTARQQKNIIDAAWDLGIRHFDTAPLYGLGDAERRLGEALRGRNESHAVYTKVGLAPSRVGQIAGRLQKPGRLILNTFPALRAPARRAAAKTAAPTSLDSRAITVSVENSLRRLQRDALEGLLLHDRTPQEVTPETISEMKTLVEKGLVIDVGVAGERTGVSQILDSPGADFTVAQVPGLGLCESERRLANREIVYGIIGPHAGSALASLERDAPLRCDLESIIDAPLRSLGDTAEALLRVELARGDVDVVLIGSTSVAHLERLWAAYERHIRLPLPSAQALHGLLGLGRLRHGVED